MDRIKKVPALPEIEYTEKIKGATEIRFPFQSEEGYRVPCHLLHGQFRRRHRHRIRSRAGGLVRLTMPSCAMCAYRDSIAATKHCSCNYVPHIAEYFDMGNLLAMSYPKYYVQVNGAEEIKEKPL